MGSTIYVKIKNVYGRELVYPSCHVSAKFAHIDASGINAVE